MNSVSEKQIPSSGTSVISSPTTWSKETLRHLRLRMGWSRADIARRLQCSSEEIEHFEEGRKVIESRFKSELEILLRQAEACSDEVRYAPSAENKIDQDALQQIDFSKVKAEFE